MPKPGRNNKCSCDSGKKYKFCCYNFDQQIQKEGIELLNDGQKNNSDLIEDLIEYLQEEYPDHKIINISNYLTSQTYRKFQIHNYNNKTIMVAEKKNNNEDVFNDRGTPDNDIIIMYRGSYRTYYHPDLPNVMESLDKMIQTRLSGQNE